MGTGNDVCGVIVEAGIRTGLADSEIFEQMDFELLIDYSAGHSSSAHWAYGVGRQGTLRRAQKMRQAPDLDDLNDYNRNL